MLLNQAGSWEPVVGQTDIEMLQGSPQLARWREGQSLCEVPPFLPPFETARKKDRGDRDPFKEEESEEKEIEQDQIQLCASEDFPVSCTSLSGLKGPTQHRRRAVLSVSRLSTLVLPAKSYYVLLQYFSGYIQNLCFERAVTLLTLTVFNYYFCTSRFCPVPTYLAEVHFSIF